MLDSPDSDELLLQATGRGDLASYARLVERYQTWAWRVAYRFSGNEEDASDIVQEAFLRLLDASGRYKPTAKFRTYFYRMETTTKAVERLLARARERLRNVLGRRKNFPRAEGDSCRRPGAPSPA